MRVRTSGKGAGVRDPMGPRGVVAAKYRTRVDRAEDKFTPK